MTYRKATENDIDFIASAAREMFSLSGSDELFNEVYLKEYLIPFVLDKGILLIKENEGVIAGVISRHPMNPNLIVVSEYIWWVREDKRNGIVGGKLLLLFEKEAKNKGASIVCLSTLEPCMISLKKRGYSYKESSHIKRI